MPANVVVRPAALLKVEPVIKRGDAVTVEAGAEELLDLAPGHRDERRASGRPDRHQGRRQAAADPGDRDRARPRRLPGL